MIKNQRAIILIFFSLLIVILAFKFGYNKIEKNKVENINTSPPIILNDDENKLPEVKETKKIEEPVVEQEKLPSKFINDNVPFVSQAPNSDWKDERLQDGCEEASVVMALAWINSENSVNKSEALKRIIEASDWFLNNIGTFHDASVQDVVRILKEFYKVNDVKIINEPKLIQLKEFLSQEKLIIVPTNGRLLGNPNFSGLGPERHMIVLTGYNDLTGEFITNDPGTRKGENYRYPYDIVLKANLSYPTGFHEKMESIEKAVIVVDK